MKDKKLLTILLVNAFFLILTIVTDILYIEMHNEYLYKTLASSTFVLCGIVNILLVFLFKLQTNKKYLIFMMIGLVFAFGGDIFLIDFFIVGAILFAIGHIFFFISYLFLSKPKWTDLIYIAVAIIISLLVIFISKVNFGDMQILVFAYAIIISAMLGKSISLIKENLKIGIYVAVGSLMFYLSDMFLMFRIFGDMPRIGSILCLAFYYPAQFVLSSSISIISLLNKKKK